MPSSSSVDPDHGGASATDLDAAAAASVVRRAGRGRPEDFASFLRTQDEVDALCEKYGVPREFTARPAGALRANSAPPPGAVCVHGRALEAGMRVPLHGFFREALAHFGIAPAQLTPNGWRTMAGFLALCRSDGVPPSLAVFRYFFLLCVVDHRHKGWYFFRSRDSSRLRFAGMPNPSSIASKDWKHEFFFLSSPEPWLCPVEWGEPSKTSFRIPVLTGVEKKSAGKLLRAHGGADVDLRMYPCNSNLAIAATMITTALRPPVPSSSSSSTCIISSPEGMDPSVYAMMKTMLADKVVSQASASASAKKVEAEPDSKAAGPPPLCGKKRGVEETSENECPPPSTLNTALSSGLCSPLPGFSRKPQRFLSRHDEDRPDWVATREQLEEAKSELASAKRDVEQEKAKAELAATGAELAKAIAGLATAEAEVVNAKAELTAAKRAADAGQEKARPELAVEGAKARLAAAKRALGEELESAKAAAVHQLLCCEDHVRRRAGRALEGYQRWRTG